MKDHVERELQAQLEDKLERMRKKDYEDAADHIEEQELSDLKDKDFAEELTSKFPEASNLIRSMNAGLLAMEDEARKETEETEPTEGTEPDLEVGDYLNQESHQEVRLSGRLDDQTYFHTLFAERGGKSEPLVITSDGEMEVIRNKKEELKRENKQVSNLNRYDYQYFTYDGKEFRFEHEITNFPGLGIFQPNNSVLNYLKDEEVSPEVYNAVREKVKKYWDHYDEEWFDVVTAWIIHTYLVNGIGFTVYLMPKGKENTGKTTLQKLITRLSYNGFFSGKNTSAASSRIAHHLQATLNIDEFEKSADSEVEGVFNTGQRKGAKYTITNMNKRKIKDQITVLKSFCPKTVSVNSTYRFDNHFLSRNIILEATRTDRNLENLETMSQKEEQEFQGLRNHLLAYSLFRHNELLKSIEEYKEELEEKGREGDKISIICGLVDHFHEEKKKARNIEEFLKSSGELQEDQLNQKLEVLLKEIISKFEEGTDQVEVSPKRLAEKVNKNLEIEEEFQISPRGVGNRLREHDVLRENWQRKRSGPNGSTRYTITREFLEDSLDRYELNTLKEKLAGTEDSGSAPSAPTSQSVDKTLKKLGGKKEPVELHELIVESKYSEDVVKEIVDEKINKGAYFEPVKGHIQLLK